MTLACEVLSALLRRPVAGGRGVGSAISASAACRLQDPSGTRGAVESPPSSPCKGLGCLRLLSNFDTQERFARRTVLLLVGLRDTIANFIMPSIRQYDF